MKKMDLKEETIKAYMEYLDRELLEDTQKTLNCLFQYNGMIY